MYFYLSLGSNIDAESSAVMMLRHLCERFGVIGAYPFRYTEPEGIESDIPFLNSLVVIRCEMSSSELKRILNAIEEDMGRDRNDPERSAKNRRADIDILGFNECLKLDVFKQAKESYVATCMRLDGNTSDLSNYGLPSYQRPATVYLDALTSNVVVIEDEFEGFEYGLKTTFEGQ